MASKFEKTIRRWWGNNVNDRPVWRGEDLPSPAYKNLLAALELAVEVRRGAWVLGKPGADREGLLRANFWEVVSAVLKPYEPYAVVGASALKLWLEDDGFAEVIDVVTRGSNTRIALGGDAVLRLERDPEFFSRRGGRGPIRTIDTAKGYPVRCEDPESLLLRLRPALLRDRPELVSAFLKGAELSCELLAASADAEGKPVKSLRLAKLLRGVGRAAAAAAIERAVRLSEKPPRLGARISLAVRLPPVLNEPGPRGDPAYVVRLRDRLRLYAERARERPAPPGKPVSLRRILAHAERTRRFDAYHSSTIEGYRVTEAEIQALMDGRPAPDAASPEEIQRRMALKGYLDAHAFVLERVRADYGTRALLTESFIKEIYALLFSPSVKAGLLDKSILTRYRDHPVYIRYSRHVPPNAAKVKDLMTCLVEEVNRVPEPAPRALVAHYGLVSVHPYRDGNGRLARFLMNYVLASAGVPWLTIRAEERDEYFAALESAHVDGNVLPLAEFLRGRLGCPASRKQFPA